MVGRDDELARLTSLIDGGAGGGALVAGPAGVGKSRLAAECLLRAGGAGLPTARATATRSAAQLPFGAVAALLPAEEGTGSIAGHDQAGYLRQCCDAFERRGEGKRLVLLVDDAHLLDDASATLVHRLAETRSAFVLATVRTGEAAPDAVAALWKDELVERLDLPGLAVDTIETLLTTALGGPVEPATLARLAARCQGNVLFLRELILGAVQSGALAEDGGHWRLVGPPMPSERLTELIEARLGHLSPGERTVLETVALGEPLGPAELAAVDTSVLEGLERQELLASRLDGQGLVVRMAHPLYGEVLRRTLPASRARELTIALADAVEAAGMAGRNDILRVATWRLASGEPVRPELVLPAGAEARARHDFPLAERLLRAGIDAGAGFEAEVLLAEVLMLQARYDDAVELLDALADAAGTHEDRARVALMRIDSLAFCGRAEEAVVALLEAGAAFPEPAWVDELAVRQAMFAVVGGFTDLAVEILEPLLPRLTGEALVTGCILGTIAYGLQGRLAEALEAHELGLATHRSLGRAHMIFDPAMTTMLGIRAHIYAGDLAAAEAMAEANHAEAQAAGRLEPQAWFAGVCAQACLAQGRIGRALRWAQESESMLRPLGRKIYYHVVARQLVEALAGAGDAAAAEEARARSDAGSVPMMRWEEGDFLRVRAWIAVARGDMPEALRLLDEGGGARRVRRRSGDRVGGPPRPGPPGPRRRRRRPPRRAGPGHRGIAGNGSGGPRPGPRGPGPRRARGRRRWLRGDRGPAARRRGGRRCRPRLAQGR